LSSISKARFDSQHDRKTKQNVLFVGIYLNTWARIFSGRDICNFPCYFLRACANLDYHACCVHFQFSNTPQYFTDLVSLSPFHTIREASVIPFFEFYFNYSSQCSCRLDIVISDDFQKTKTKTKTLKALSVIWVEEVTPDREYKTILSYSHISQIRNPSYFLRQQFLLFKTMSSFLHSFSASIAFLEGHAS
jgi:hypothetical protein